jgi:agmatinase
MNYSTLAPARSFLDWPIETDPRHMAAPLALIGIPFSEPYAGDEFPNDQTRAPAAFRQAFAKFIDEGDHWDFDFDATLASILPARCIDCGDVQWCDDGYDVYLRQTSECLRNLWRGGAQVMIIGGDHGVTIPALDALDAVGESVYILHIDAHLDWREEVGGVARGYSSPLRWASTKPYISGMTQIGLRSTGSARRAEVDAARAYGSQLFTADRYHDVGNDAVLATIPENGSVYITIDADGMDPTEAPGVQWPAPGGLLFRQVAPLLREIARRQRVVGMDIVEIAPRFDSTNGITSVLAGRLFLNVIGASWRADGAYGRGRAVLLDGNL